MHEHVRSPLSPQNISEEFLEVFNQIKTSAEKSKVLNLVKEPTKSELRFCTKNVELEIGIALNSNGNWNMVKGAKGIITFPKKIENEADILAHTHLNDYAYLEGLPDLPSSDDICTATISKRMRFIVHANGITYFTGIARNPITKDLFFPKNLKEVKHLYSIFLRTQLRFLNIDAENHLMRDQTYKEVVLDKMEVVISQKTWRELPNKNPLSQFPFRPGV